MLNHTLRRVMLRRPRATAAGTAEVAAPAVPAPVAAAPELDISPTDPIVPYFQSAPGAV